MAPDTQKPPSFRPSVRGPRVRSERSICPRLWLKLSLAARGALPDGYDECGAGFDAMTLSALGLDRDKTIEFVRTAKPRYMEFEKWVVANGKTDKASDRGAQRRDSRLQPRRRARRLDAGLLRRRERRR